MGQPSGMLALFQEVAPRYQKALYVQCVYEALMAFNESVAQLADQITMPFTQEHLLLAPLTLRVSRPLVDVIRAVLGCWRVSLIALSHPSLQMMCSVGSGFTDEQEQTRQELADSLDFPSVFGDTALANLMSNQEVIFASDRLPSSVRSLLGIEATTLLTVPLTLEQELAGVLVIYKQGWDCGYTGVPPFQGKQPWRMCRYA